MKRFLLFFLLLGVFGAKAQVLLSVNLSVSDSTVRSGASFFYSINFAITSSNQPGNNVVITDTLPPYVNFLSFVPSSLVSSTSYDAVTRVVVIHLVNPLPAGTTGSLQINCAFSNLATPNNTVAKNVVSIQSSNALIARSDTATIISTAKAPYLTMTKGVVVYDAVNKIVRWRVSTNVGSDVGLLAIYRASIVDTLPDGAKFISASNGGHETSIGSGIIVWDYLDSMFVSGAIHNSYIYDTVTVQYPTTPYGSNLFNSMSLKGTLLGNIPFQFTSNVAQYILSPPLSGAGCRNSFGSYLSEVGDTLSSIYVPFYNTGNVALDSASIIVRIPEQVELYGAFEADSLLHPSIYYTTNTAPNTKVAMPTKLLRYKGLFNYVPTPVPPVLPNGTFVQTVIISYSKVPIGFETAFQIPISILSKDRSGNKVVSTLPNYPQSPCDSIGTCITMQEEINYSYSSQQFTSICTSFGMPRGVAPNVYSTQKAILNPKNFVAGDTVSFRLSFGNIGDALVNTILLDTLANVFEFIPNSWNCTYGRNNNDGKPVKLSPANPQFSQQGQVLKFDFTNDTNQFANSGVSVSYKVKIINNTPAGVYYNKYYGRADNSKGVWSAQVGVLVNSLYSLTADKGVKGKIDSTYLFYPTNATTINGSEVSYKLRIHNTGNTKLKDLVLVDALPYKGDAKGSEFTPFMTSLPIANQNNIAIHYSLDSTICINEISPPISPVGCIVPTWTTVAPIDLKKVKALKFLFLDSLKGGDSLNVTWNMSAPANLQVNQVAYNDFHYQARKADDNTLLLTTSPNKVGVVISALAQVGQYIWLDRNKNGIQDEDKKEGLNGMVVQLWKLGADNTPNTSDDILVGDTVTTDNAKGESGYYRFTTLPDRYFLKFKVDTCRFHKTTSFDYVTGVFSLLPAQLKFDMNLGLAQDSILVSGNTQACLGASVVLESKLESDYTNPNYLWQKSDDNGISWKDLAGQNQAKLLISTIAEVDSGLYRVLASENGRIQTNCRIVSDTIRLKVSNSLAKPIYPDTTICAGDKVILNKSIPAASGSYYWYKTPKGGSPIANNFSPSISSNTSFYLVDSIAGGCKSERVEVKINVQPKPKDPLFSIESICFGEQIVLNKTTPAASGSYYWFKTSTGGNPIPNNFTTPVLTSNTTYYLIDSVSGGCNSKRTPVTILIKDCPKDSVLDQSKEIFFPNGFSPNEDGISDFYTVFNIPEGVKVSIWFFNRWGDLVYKNENYQNNWEGKCETNLCLGEKLPSGTYFLHSILSNGNKYKTNVTLIR